MSYLIPRLWNQVNLFSPPLAQYNFLNTKLTSLFTPCHHFPPVNFTKDWLDNNHTASSINANVHQSQEEMDQNQVYGTIQTPQYDTEPGKSVFTTNRPNYLSGHRVQVEFD